MTVAGQNLGLVFNFADGEDGWGAAANQWATALEYLLFAKALTFGDDAAPGAPVEGATYVVGDAPAGAWAGKAGQVAVRTGGQWVFFAPKIGWRIRDLSADKDMEFNGLAWAPYLASAATAAGGVDDTRPISALGAAAAITQGLLDRGITTPAASNWDLAFKDADGNVYGGVRRGDMEVGMAGTSTDIAQLYASTEAASRATPRRHGLPNGALLRAECIGVFETGQSFGVGTSARVPLSSTPHIGPDGLPDVFMMGLSAKPAESNPTTTVWAPQGGDPTFQPAIATVDDTTDDLPRTAAEIAAAPAADGRGEMMSNGAVNAIATRWAACPTAGLKKWVIGSVAVGGRTIEELSLGATPELFNRWRDMLDNFVLASAGMTRAVGAVFFDQGQANYIRGTQDKDTYKALLLQYVTDVNTLIRTKTGQTLDPFWFFNQTSGLWVKDDAFLSISMAQLELCREYPGLFTMVGPTHDVPDNRAFLDSHLSANGYRWVGERWCRAFWHVAVDGFLWEPFAPIRTRAFNTSPGSVVYVTFSVPFPPLKLGDVYEGATLIHYADYGFKVYDVAGEVLVLSVEQIDAVTVKLSLNRVIDVDSAVVQQGDNAVHDGSACLFDSCPAPSQTSYVYDVATLNMPAAENIAALVGKPYPAANPGCLFRVPVNGDF